MKEALTKEEELAAAVAAAAEFRTNPGGMVKFRCRCGKRIVEPLHQIGHKGYCRKCRRGVVVPDFDGASVLAFRCECGFDVPIGEVRWGRGVCPRCGRLVPVRPKPQRAPFPVLPFILLAGALSVSLLLILIALAIPK
jgi:hypothetical protein